MKRLHDETLRRKNEGGYFVRYGTKEDRMFALAPERGGVKTGSSDRRTRRSENLLLEALVSLVVEKDYGSITVLEILDRANVGRTTFYAHFTDKDDLLVRAVQRLQETLEVRLANQKKVDRPGERLVAFGLPPFEHLFINRAIYKALRRSGARPIMTEYIPVMIANLITDKSRPKPGRARKGGVEIPDDFLVRFVVSTFTSLVSWWLDSQDPLPPKEIDAIFRALILSDLSING
jgi:AcrR family transcriptional regulator